MQDVHGLKVEGANSSHEDLLELLLHHGLGPVLALDDGLSFTQPVSQALDLLAVLRADVLELLLDCFLKVLSALNDLPLLVVLLPAQEDSALLDLLVLAKLVLKHELRVLLEVTILAEAIEGLVLEKLNAKEHLALAGPEGHALTASVQLLALLGLESKALFKLLDLVLFDT